MCLDSPREPEFDEISELAAQVCHTPIALVTLVDAERQWFKSSLGIDQEEIPRELSFCAYAIAEEQNAFVVPDARADPRFNRLPLVTDDPYVRFYAGIPLEMKSGHNLGTLCVLDSEPRDLTEHQRRALQALAHQVTALLELRRYRRELLRQLNVAERPEDALSSTWDSISQLARRIRQVFWLEDPDAGEIVYLSPSFDLLWGRSRADFTGKPPSALLEAVHPHDRALVAERKGPEPIDYRIQRRDGRVRWINHESFELITAGGARRVASLAEDVTDRVTAEAALHVSEQRFRQMLEHLDDAVCVAEPETLRPVFVNRAYERIWGRSPDSLYERSDSWTDAIHPDDRWRLDAGLERWADTARFDQELRILRPDGELRWVRARAFPIVGEDGEWLLLAGMGEDVTEQKTARAERGRLEETLGQAQKLEVVGRLAGGVAHDFNNLLAIIAGSASILDERVEPDELRTETREILDATDRAAKLVTQLLAVSRPRTPATASTDLTLLARGTEGLLRRTLGEHIRIALDLDPATPPARLDRSHAEQVLLNLAVNARDAMPGEACSSISVSLRRRSRAAGGVGQRHRDPRGAARPHLRALLHHQGGERHRPRALHRPAHRALGGRGYRSPLPSRWRDQLRAAVAGGHGCARRGGRPGRRGRARARHRDDPRRRGRGTAAARDRTNARAGRLPGAGAGHGARRARADPWRLHRLRPAADRSGDAGPVGRGARHASWPRSARILPPSSCRGTRPMGRLGHGRARTP